MGGFVDMTIFYFTGTGNSLAVAKRIGGGDAKLLSIPQVIDGGIAHFKDDAIGVVFPVYFYTLPKMVIRFLRKVRLEAEYTFIIGTQGGMSGACMRVAQKSAKHAGSKFDYAACISIMSNFLPRFPVEQEIAIMPEKNFEGNLARVIDDIKNRKRAPIKANIFMRCVTAVASQFFKHPERKQKKYYSVSDKCNKCGICAKVCPVKNIVVADSVKFADRCEYCFACLHLCPQNALRHKKQKSEKRWRHPDVTLAEIIAANNRTDGKNV